MNTLGKCGFLGFQNSSKPTNYNSAVNTGTNDSSNNMEEEGTSYFMKF